jgi:6-pyruvoyltetrahydropterin/6-carboxytetrahydropterin synthase
MQAGSVLRVSAAPSTPVIVPLVQAQLEQTAMLNGDQNVRLQSLIAHKTDTDTGYTQCLREDVFNPRMRAFALELIQFSAQVQRECSDPQLFARYLPAAGWAYTGGASQADNGTRPWPNPPA